MATHPGRRVGTASTCYDPSGLAARARGGRRAVPAETGQNFVITCEPLSRSFILLSGLSSIDVIGSGTLVAAITVTLRYRAAVVGGLRALSTLYGPT